MLSSGLAKRTSLIGTAGARDSWPERVLAVQLVVVEVDRAGHEAARGERAIDAAVASFALQRADQAPHRRAEGDDLPRLRREDGAHGVERLELVAQSAAQRPARAVRIDEDPTRA